MSERSEGPDRSDDPERGRDGDLWGWEKQTPEPTAPYQPSYPPPPPAPQPGYQSSSYGSPSYESSPYGQPGYGPPAPYAPPGAWPGGYVQPPPNDGLGIAAMVVGIASLVLMCGYGIGLLGSPVALFMGRASMKRIDRSQGTLGGRGQAQAGFILGIIGTVLLVLLLLAVAAALVLVFNVDGTTSP